MAITYAAPAMTSLLLPDDSYSDPVPMMSHAASSTSRDRAFADKNVTTTRGGLTATNIDLIELARNSYEFMTKVSGASVHVLEPERTDPVCA
ncbi:unnamed protein product [Somion occarium]|uniref:Uncharacterized protein n=1 Tax=Somion occarium TaxID=3059160 RepID=A0ABP1DTZ7_9APHY